MQKFISLTSIPAPLEMDNVDTDIIIPKQFLRTIERTGLKKGLFYDLRHDESGNNHSKFILDNAPYNQSQILVTGKNFGCGSSREHAPWALLDFGITAIIATSFSDIFYNNCFKNGILPIILSENNVQKIFKIAKVYEKISIDLPSQKITFQNSEDITFEIDPFRKKCLLEGLDDIGLTLEKKKFIYSFESADKKIRPWLYA